VRQPKGWGARDRGSAQARGYGWAWKKLRLKVMTRDRGLCQMCLGNHRAVIATDVDHIIGKARGGSDDLANLQALCGPCHDTKTATERAARQ
jgi:5-methylcytosine-specific restriction enzyme A